MNIKDVLIIGGGIAGLVCAIDLSKRGFSVLVIEKKDFPRHKVCGEYLSNEVKPYLQKLGFNPIQHGAKEIKRFMITAQNGANASCRMKMGGFSLSRYTLDNSLYELAIQVGVKVLTQISVLNTSYGLNSDFQITTSHQTYHAKVVIGAFGRRSNIDKELRKNYFNRKTDYIGIKHHFEGKYPEDLVGLHNFEGGYCGVSSIEKGLINVSYLTDKKTLNKFKDIEELEKNHLSENPFLREIFNNSKPIFKNPLVVSQINFEIKSPISQHILMIGDAAGLIHPLCGNGMAMGIHSAKISAELVTQFLHQKINRNELEQQYTKKWNNTFKTRLRFGNAVQPLFGRNWTANLAVKTLQLFPSILPQIITLSHGNYIK